MLKTHDTPNPIPAATPGPARPQKHPRRPACKVLPKKPDPVSEEPKSGSTPTTIPKGEGRSPPPFGIVLGAAGAARTQQVDNFRQAQILLNGSLRMLREVGGGVQMRIEDPGRTLYSISPTLGTVSETNISRRPPGEAYTSPRYTRAPCRSGFWAAFGYAQKAVPSYRQGDREHLRPVPLPTPCRRGCGGAWRTPKWILIPGGCAGRTSRPAAQDKLPLRIQHAAARSEAMLAQVGKSAH